MDLDPVILIIAASAYFIGGLSKGALGFGLPMIAIPMLTAVGSLPFALSVAVPPVVATNLWQIWKFRQHRNVSFLRRFLSIGMIGLLLGTLLLKNIEDAYLEIALGCLVLTYLLRSRTKRDVLSSKISHKIAPLIGGLAGMVHGTTGLSGMVGTPFFHAAGLARPAFIFSNSMMFIVFSAMHMPALAAVGLYDPPAILIGLLVTGPAFAGLWIGGRVGERLNAATFLKLVQGMLAIAAVLPIWNGLSKLFFST
jgi:uncharacterized membrane protein YfcA